MTARKLFRILAGLSLIFLIFDKARCFDFPSRIAKENLSPPSLWPWPANISFSTGYVIIPDACQFQFALNFSYRHRFYEETLSEYHSKIFKGASCGVSDRLELIKRLLNPSTTYKQGDEFRKTNRLTITVEQPEIDLILNSHLPDLPEDYTLEITSFSELYLRAKNYLSFLRGLETFSQLVKNFKSGRAANFFFISHTPIRINDFPRFPFRGVMLDTSRHFLSVETIKKTIRAMSYNKMNVFHWHVTDSDSFPMYMARERNMTRFGAFSMESVYYEDDIKHIIAYAKRHGVEVVPEFDSPGHTRSWGLAPAFEEGMSCVNKSWGRYANQPPAGQIDPSKALAFDIVEKVFSQANDYFNGSVIHLGGDEIKESCYENETVTVTVKQYMERARNYTKGKKAIYWHDTFYFQDKDILQYWGERNYFQSFFNGKKDKASFIYSSYEDLYLDCGWSNEFGDKNTWCSGPKKTSDIYSIDLLSFCKKDCDKLLGAEAVLFGEMATDGCVDWKVWPKASALAERLWSLSPNPKMGRSEWVRLADNNKRMKNRGIGVSAIWREACDRDPERCLREMA